MTGGLFVFFIPSFEKDRYDLTHVWLNIATGGGVIILYSVVLGSSATKINTQSSNP
jgi:hypothetical protein